MIGTKVDRAKTPFWQVAFYWIIDAFMVQPSNQSTIRRKNASIAHLKINNVSRCIPMFASQCKKSLESWKSSNKPVDFCFESKKISFAIISEMMFGSDVSDKLHTIQLEDHTSGKLMKHSFFEAFQKVFKDCGDVKSNPLTVLFPRFVEFGLGHTNKVNKRNC